MVRQKQVGWKADNVLLVNVFLHTLGDTGVVTQRRLAVLLCWNTRGGLNAS